MPSFSDGYELTGYLAAKTDTDRIIPVYEALRFTYRLASRIEVITHDAEIDQINPNRTRDPLTIIKMEKKCNEFVAQHIKSWDMKNSRGEPVAISGDAMGAINPLLFRRLNEIVRGTDVCDPCPDGTPAAPNASELAGN